MTKCSGCGEAGVALSLVAREVLSAVDSSQPYDLLLLPVPAIPSDHRW